MLKFKVAYAMPACEVQCGFFHKTIAKVYAGAQGFYLGMATPEVPIMFKPKKYQDKGTIIYEIIMTNDTVEELEKLRAGKEILFKLDVVGECNDEANELCRTEPVSYEADQKEWVEALKAMRFKGGLIFELPMNISPDEEIGAALIAIDKAKEHLYHGHYDDVVAKCRISLESMIVNSGEIDSVRSAAKTNKKSMNKNQRFFHALDQLVHFTHLSHHPDEEGKYVSFTRSEAIFVLGSTIAAVSSYCESKN